MTVTTIFALVTITALTIAYYYVRSELPLPTPYIPILPPPQKRTYNFSRDVVCFVGDRRPLTGRITGWNPKRFAASIQFRSRITFPTDMYKEHDSVALVPLLTVSKRLVVALIKYAFSDQMFVMIQQYLADGSEAFEIEVWPVTPLDNQWHGVSIKRSENSYIVTVDSKTSTHNVDDSRTYPPLHTVETITLGGSQTDLPSRWLNEYKQYSFVGCMRNVFVDGKNSVEFTTGGTQYVSPTLSCYPSPVPMPIATDIDVYKSTVGFDTTSVLRRPIEGTTLTGNQFIISFSLLLYYNPYRPEVLGLVGINVPEGAAVDDASYILITREIDGSVKLVIWQSGEWIYGWQTDAGVLIKDDKYRSFQILNRGISYPMSSRFEMTVDGHVSGKLLTASQKTVDFNIPSTGIISLGGLLDGVSNFGGNMRQFSINYSTKSLLFNRYAVW